MMKDWEVLGIEPTLDASIIKKAYAKQLKLNHPEDNPQGYQELREAYDRLLKEVKNQSFHHREESIHNEAKGAKNFEKPTQGQTMDAGDDIEDTEIPKENDYYSKENDQVINEFLDKVSQLYQNFFQRIEYKYWEELLNGTIIWNLEASRIVNRKLLDFLLNNSLLPRNIWRYLNSYFNWAAQEEYIRDNYNSAFVNYLFLQIGNERVLRYNFFDRSLNINYEEYVFYRESAFIALMNNNLGNAQMYLSKATEVYPRDPDLYCLRGEYYIRTRDYQRAEHEFQAAFAINPNDIYIYYYKAYAYYFAGLYTEALKICNMINNSGQFNYDLLTLSGKCYLKMGNLNKAERIFFDNLRLNPSDNELKECLREIIHQHGLYIKKHRFALARQMRLNKIAKELQEPNQKENDQNNRINFGQLAFMLLSIIIMITALILVILKLDDTRVIGAIAAIVVLLVRFLYLRLKKGKTE